MATPISFVSLATVLSSLLLLFPLCSLKKSYAYAIEGNKITRTCLQARTIKAASLLPSDVCNQYAKAHKGSSIEVVHKYGPCIQRKQEKAASVPSRVEILLHDQLRVDSLHARFRVNASGGVFKEKQTIVPARSGAAIGATGNYLVKIGLGTPNNELTAIVDTGSAITWVQCEPCLVPCYEQVEPKFDPTKSTSYKNISCSSTSCDLLIRDARGVRNCSSSTCIYGIQYGDGSFSVGFFATETLTIGSFDVFNNFSFGCGQINRGFRGAAGLLGLGRSRLSLVSQTANKYKNLFSYCFPSSSSSTGYLNFGAKFSKTVKFTPLSRAFQKTPFYGLDIIGITVCGKKLSIDASVFISAGAIIDSGTAITRLPSGAYSALSTAFRQQMTKYPMTDGIAPLDTCYDFSKFDWVLIPDISVFFKGGVQVDIDTLGVFVVVDGLQKVCLAFAANSDDNDFAIFGNTQQKTYEVVYDAAKGRVGFAPRGCN